MTKALLKKQIMEVFSWVYFDRKNGKSRTKGGILGYAALYIFIFGFLGIFFYQIAGELCKPLFDVGYGWLYFTLMGLVAVAMGVFGSVFNTYSSLYTAKDNDFLLSLPVPPGKILLVRLLGVYLMGLMYELIIEIPTVLVYFITVKSTVLSVVFSLLMPIILSFLILTLSCIFGFCVAAISSKVKSKNILTVLLSLIFMGAYYFIYARAYQIVQSILESPEKIGNNIKGILYPLYQMGLGAQGSPLSFLFFVLIIGVLFFITYLVLSRSFLSIATANKGSVKKVYKEKSAKASSVEKALFLKELRRFKGCPIYMLNCGLGIVMMPVAAIVVLIKGSDFSLMLTEMLGEYIGIIPLLATAAICTLSTMNDITSPSVSLEGKNIWLVQSFPIPAKKVLHAKIKLHLLLTFIPTALLAVCVCASFKIPVQYAVLVLLFALIFVLLMALIGLVLNLKMPNLNWKDETVPVKQSLCVMLALFGGWAIILGLGAIYFLIMKFVTPLIYLIAISVIAAVISIILLRWINTEGAKIFETL
ncbi:MAG: hypothetical protein ACI4IF_07625 [Acutalibacteraceae bacterium]